MDSAWPQEAYYFLSSKIGTAQSYCPAASGVGLLRFAPRWVRSLASSVVV